MITIFGILLGAWLFTFVHNTAAANSACDSAEKNNRNWWLNHHEDDGRSSVDVIFDHYNSFSYKNWFGFKSYLYPFHLPMNVCDRLHDE